MQQEHAALIASPCDVSKVFSQRQRVDDVLVLLKTPAHGNCRRPGDNKETSAGSGDELTCAVASLRKGKNTVQHVFFFEHSSEDQTRQRAGQKCHDHPQDNVAGVKHNAEDLKAQKSMRGGHSRATRVLAVHIAHGQ